MDPTTVTPPTPPDTTEPLPETPTPVPAAVDVPPSPPTDDASVPDEPVVLPPAQVATTPPKRHLTWLIALVVLIVVGAGLYLVYHYGQTNSTPAMTVKKDIPVLRIGAAEPLPVSIYPNVDDSSYTSDIDAQAFDTLTRFYDLTKVGPDLALSWTNPDSSTWIFKLRPNVKFHSGRTMTATDVKASLDGVQNFTLGPEYGSTIQSVSVVDPLTVKIVTKGADPILPNELTELYIYDTTSKTPNSLLNGTGAYTLKPGTNIKNSVDLVAFDQYFGGRPHVRELIYTSYSSIAPLVADEKAGKIDIAAVQTQETAQSAQISTTTTVTLPAPGVAHLVPNTLNGSPLSKLAVRNALMQAIDANAIMKIRGINGTLASQIVAPNIPGYDSSIVRPAYSVSAAKAALAAAGYPNGFSFLFTYYSSAQPLADELKRQLALVGVTVNEDPQTDFDVLGAKVFGGQTDMYYNTLNTSLVDGSDFLSPILDNTKFYENPQINQLFATADQTIDPAKRLTLLKQVVDAEVADRADFPLYTSGNSYFVVPKDISFVPQRFGGETGVFFYQVYGK